LEFDLSENQQTIASLVREAAKNEEKFLNVLNNIMYGDVPERVEEFFAKLNIPRSAKADDTLVEGGGLTQEGELKVTTFDVEYSVSEGIQKCIDRHMRKLKWHTAHPAVASSGNCVRLYRAMGIITEYRIKRVILLLGTKERMTVDEWGISRELLNRSYRELREATGIVTGPWIDAVFGLDAREEMLEILKDFPEMVSGFTKTLHVLREQIEARRLQMEVKPDAYPVVRPPRYFGGDLLDSGSWRHFWGELSGMNDALRNSLGL